MRPRPVKFTTLLCRERPAQAGWIGPRRTLDEHVERAADEPLGALVRPPLHHLDQSLQALDLELVRHLIGQPAASVPRRGE